MAMHVPPNHFAIVVALCALLGHTSAWAQDLALTTQSEAGFRRFIQMAKKGKLGDDINDANVGVSQSYARIELLGAGATKTLLLTRRSAAQDLCRYFDIASEGEEAISAADLRRLGKALDEAFHEDPFVVAVDFFGAAPGDPALSLSEAWGDGGWRGVFRACERRLTALAGIGYTTIVIAMIAVASLGGVVVLWGSSPPRGVVTDERSELGS